MVNYVEGCHQIAIKLRKGTSRQKRVENHCVTESEIPIRVNELQSILAEAEIASPAFNGKVSKAEKSGTPKNWQNIEKIIY